MKKKYIKTCINLKISFRRNELYLKT